MEARRSELWGQKSSQNLGFEGMGREARIRSRIKGGQTGWVQETQQEEELGKKNVY